VAAPVELDLRPGLERRAAGVDERGARRRRVRAADPRERLGPPQREGRPQMPGRGVRIMPLMFGAADARREHLAIHAPRVDTQLVARGRQRDRIAPQRPAQPGPVLLDDVRAVRGRLLAPHGVDDLRRRHRTVRRE
jgi:hypothetical protein